MLNSCRRENVSQIHTFTCKRFPVDAIEFPNAICDERSTQACLLLILRADGSPAKGRNGNSIVANP